MTCYARAQHVMVRDGAPSRTMLRGAPEPKRMFESGAPEPGQVFVLYNRGVPGSVSSLVMTLLWHRGAWFVNPSLCKRMIVFAFSLFMRPPGRAAGASSG